MTDPNLREIIIDILDEILEQDGYLHLVLNQALDKYQYLSKQQRAFISRVSRGCVEQLIQIDAVLGQFVKKPKVSKMKPAIRCILRSSVYQILYMGGVPDSAVCNEAVKLAKKKGYGGLGGFVNGVLRNISRNKEGISFSTLSEQYSMPQWIIDLWENQYGEDKTKEMLSALLEKKKTAIRVNTSKISVEELRTQLEDQGIKVEKCPEISYGLYIGDYDYLKAIPQFVQGLFYVQDFSSMMVAHVAEIKKDDYIMDVCAAPGGKSLHAAELLQGSGMVEARDVSDYKVSLMQENIDKSGMKNIRAVKWDATVLDEASVEKADVVICDAPCSGLGVISGKPDIKYHMSREKQLELAKLQRNILSTVWRYVKPEGTLLYSTCTVCQEENQKNVEWFLKEYRSFELVEMRQLFPVDGTQDGFFYAKMKRGK
ncbi:MAG: 16S rRNA (cytosine(967)-C(5))-methyltransferase RsmB [Lachnospiraceae bacterium]|nr:16S rRNA (cytosine(967)-C(5))-methyltransferase RsmB [Lachnospiraceae bacterium]